MGMPAAGSTARHAGIAVSIAEWIDNSIRRTPDRIATGTADGRMRVSYRQLHELVRALAGQLAESGIARTGPIGLYCDNSPEFVVTLLGAWSAGAVVVPIDPQLIAAEVETRLAAVNASAVVLPRRLRDSYPADPGTPSAFMVEIDAAGNYVTSPAAATARARRLQRRAAEVLAPPKQQILPCSFSLREVPERPRSCRSRTATSARP
jgi:acyl-coenzyme A synthetase/AMP-(fatty) acid ligase